VLGSKVLVSRRMKIVPEEQAAQLRGHQQGQKGKGGSSTGFHVGELEKYSIIYVGSLQRGREELT